MIVSAIVAASENHIIGRDGGIPWKIRDDMRLFKEKTTGHFLVTGRKNFECMGSKTLPNRKTIVISNQLPEKENENDCWVVRDMESALKVAKDHGEKECFVIGGAQIYHMAKPFLDRIYYSTVHAEIDGDTKLNPFDFSQYEITESKEYSQSDVNQFSFTFNLYQKNSK